MEKGIFGTIHKKYERKGQKAINYLVRVKEGEVPNAIYHPAIGWIDVAWGYAGTASSDGYGLSKINKYHSNVVPKLEQIIKSLSIKSRSQNRVILENERYKAAVSFVWFDKQKTWLLTLFEKK